jgi:Mg-chelatase subunit ChlI
MRMYILIKEVVKKMLDILESGWARIEINGLIGYILEYYK